MSGESKGVLESNGRPLDLVIQNTGFNLFLLVVLGLWLMVESTGAFVWRLS